MRARSRLGLLVIATLLVACADKGSDAEIGPMSYSGTPPKAGTSNPGNDDDDEDDDDDMRGDRDAGIGVGGGSVPPFESSGESRKPVDTSGVSKFSSLLDETKQLDTLSPAEITSACQRYESYLDGEIPPAEAEVAFCFYDDASAAKSVAECNSIVDDCRTTTTFSAGACPLEALTTDSECSVTVEDFEACATELAAIGSAFVSYYDCSLLESAKLPTPPQPLVGTPVACQFLYGSCPELQ